ncbi:MAG: 2-(3-amino-3-carboxypropyl)histidine synthase [bacterium]|nr:2-(3-amino-3-carboxypropyl)histidine synthase [bacterium]
MKTMFIESKSNADIKLPENHMEELPEKIGLVTTVQHIHKISELKKQLEKAGKLVFLLKGTRSKYQGQILGCDFPKEFEKEIEAFLYVGSGTFHPSSLPEKANIFIYNPLSKVFHKLEVKKRKGAYLKFLHADNIGVLISTKPGQLNKKATELKFKDKNTYYFIFDTLDYTELQNFTFIDCFVNTACPRIADDSQSIGRPVVNIDEVESFI